MKQPWKYALVAVLLSMAGVCALVVLRRAGESFWEAGLMGPYEGIPFPAQVTTQPVSALLMPGVGQLEVHDRSAEIAPVLMLRDADGNVRWSRLLRPERRNEDGTIEFAFLRDLRLLRIERDAKGHRVRLICDWQWGGIEGGLIYLNPDFTFRAFALSW